MKPTSERYIYTWGAEYLTYTLFRCVKQIFPCSVNLENGNIGVVKQNDYVNDEFNVLAQDFKNATKERAFITFENQTEYYTNFALQRIDVLLQNYRKRIIDNIMKIQRNKGI